MQDTTQKMRLLTIMREQALSKAHKGWVGMDVLALSKATGISPHDVTHALYDLRKQNLIAFHESKSVGRARKNGVKSEGGTPYGAIPVRIRVTGALDEDTWASLTAPVATDEDVAAEEARLQEWAETVVIEDDVVVPPDEIKDVVEAAAAYEAIMEMDDSPSLLLGLPELARLRTEGETMAAAAAMLESVGKSDLASLVREEAETLTRRDREMLELMKRLEEAGLFDD